MIFNKNFKNSLYSLILRFSALVAKFFLVILIVKKLDTDSLGEFGLFNSTISLLILLIGLDFYNFNTRLILKSINMLDVAKHLNNQFFLHIITYIIFFPIIFLIFQYDVISFKYIYLFYLILIFEHITLEQGRLLFTFSKPIKSNIVFFIKRGLWVYMILFLFILDNSILTLNNIFFFWLISTFIAFLLGSFWLKEHMNFNNFVSDLDIKLILKGLSSACIFLIAALTFKGIDFVSRYILQFYTNNEIVGVYTFFFAFASTIELFIYTGIYSIKLPKLITLHSSNTKAYYTEFKKFGITLVLINVSVAILLAIIMEPFLIILAKNKFIEYKNVFFFMLISVSFLNFSLIPHIHLYVNHKENLILLNSIIAFSVLIISSFLLVPNYGIMGTVFSITACYFALLLGKIISSLNLK